jgi:hypothetical protein
MSIIMLWGRINSVEATTSYPNKYKIAHFNKYNNDMVRTWN